MKSKFDAFVDFFVEYWLMILGVVFIVIAAIGISTNMSAINSLNKKANNNKEKLVELKRELKRELKETNKKDANNVSKKVKTDGINATSIGNKLVAAQKDIVSVYLKRGQLSKEDRDKLSNATAVMTENTGVTPSASDMWLRNTKWNLKLNTVVTYSDTTMPVLFTMTNQNGDMMGLVTARYDSTANQITNITVQYTSAGTKDFQNITTNN